MGKRLDIPSLGVAFLPTTWEDQVDALAPVREYDLERDLHLNQVLKELRLGRTVLVRGPWEEMTRLLDQVERRRDELVAGQVARGRGGGRKAYNAAYEAILSRFLVSASSGGEIHTDPPFTIPHLVELLGDYRRAAEGAPLLVPVAALRDLIGILDERYPVDALEAELWAPNTVLQPRQQDVYHLMRQRLEALFPEIGRGPCCLDMGSGSGVLALLMARIWAPLQPKIWATDLLPEALATTRINVGRLAQEGVVDPTGIHITEGGDLYEPIAERRFDLVAFNPPWANAKPRTRLEIARFDWNQETVAKFLQQTPNHLKPGGHLLLFYADNAGPSAIEGVKEESKKAGLQIVETLSQRIRVTRRWEHIYLYDMVQSGS